MLLGDRILEANQLLAKGSADITLRLDELIVETAHYMGIGALNTIYAVKPEAVLLGGAMTFGGRETVTYVPVMIIMPGPTGMKQVAVFYRSNVGFGGAVPIGKDSNRDVPMKVTVLCDTSRALGDQLGFFEEYTPA